MTMDTGPFRSSSRYHRATNSKTQLWHRPLGAIPKHVRPHTQPATAIESRNSGANQDRRQLFHLTRCAVEDLKKFNALRHKNADNRVTNLSAGANFTKEHLSSIKPSVTFPSLTFETSVHEVGTVSALTTLRQQQHHIGHYHPTYIVTKSPTQEEESSKDPAETLPPLNKIIKTFTSPTPVFNTAHNDTSTHTSRQAKHKHSHLKAQSRHHGHEQHTVKVKDNNSKQATNAKLVEETVVWTDETDKEDAPQHTDGVKVSGDVGTRDLPVTDERHDYDRKCELRHSYLASILEEGEKDGRDSSSPLISENSDSVCDLRQLLPDRDSITLHEANDDVYADSNAEGKTKLPDADKPAVPHVIWPSNKNFTPRTMFIYGSPSESASSVIMPSHSVDCPLCHGFQPTRTGNTCPPNSPTPILNKVYGFYPVEY